MKGTNALNRGEWSEIYSLFKILADGCLIGSKGNLEPDGTKFYVIYIKHKHSSSATEIYYYPTKEYITLRHGQKKSNVSIAEFVKNYKLIFEEIISNKSTTFTIPKADPFIKKVYSPRLKSPNKDKSDLTISVKNVILDSELEYGFSVKSNLAGKSTLLNASSGTNFIYKIGKYKGQTLDKSLGVLKCKDLLACLQENAVEIKFHKMESDVYEYNLGLIDSRMPEIISSVLLSYFSKKGTSLKDLLAIIEKENPLNFKSVDYYQAKILDFLMATALGMVPKTKWNKLYDSDGGLIVVKNNGDIVTFFIVHQVLLKAFQEYLINNTFLDTPSSTRHKFGFIYKENGEIYMKLNLQIRLR